VRGGSNELADGVIQRHQIVAIDVANLRRLTGADDHASGPSGRNGTVFRGCLGQVLRSTETVVSFAPSSVSQLDDDDAFVGRVGV